MTKTVCNLKPIGCGLIKGSQLKTLVGSDFLESRISPTKIFRKLLIFKVATLIKRLIES